MENEKYLQVHMDFKKFRQFFSDLFCIQFFISFEVLRFFTLSMFEFVTHELTVHVIV